jgi:hypothetical protein
MVIYHCTSDALRKKLLAENDPDLVRVTDIARAEEESTRYSSTISIGTNRSALVLHDALASNKASSNQVRSLVVICQSCGLRHGEDRECTANGRECYRCGSIGHFTRMCQEATIAEPRKQKARTAVVLDQGGDKVEHRSEHLLQVQEIGKRRRGWYQFLYLRGKKVEFLVDTAADATVLSEHTARAITRNIWRTRRVFKSYGGTRVPVIGEFEASAKYKGQSLNCNFVVAGGDCQNILGLTELKRLGLT